MDEQADDAEAVKGVHKKGECMALSRQDILYRSCPLVPSSSLQVLGMVLVSIFVVIALLIISLIDSSQAREVPLRTYHVLPPAFLSLKTRHTTSRLFAKSGYNIALISRNSDRLHKFAAELKTAETDVSARESYLPQGSSSRSYYAGSGVPNNRL